MSAMNELERLRDRATMQSLRIETLEIQVRSLVPRADALLATAHQLRDQNDDLAKQLKALEVAVKAGFGSFIDRLEAIEGRIDWRPKS